LKLKAHQQLDRAVMKLYEFPVKDFTEANRVTALMGCMWGWWEKNKSKTAADI